MRLLDVTLPRRRLTLLLVACVVPLGARVCYVHDRTWDFALQPSATPEKVVFGDRDYRRGEDVTAVDDGFVESGRTMGGGTIYAPAGPSAPTVIDVVDGSRVVDYALMGGP